MTDPFPCRINILLGMFTVCLLCTSAENQCKIHKEMADCSHLKLSQIPADLPSNITALNLSHNQLKGLPPANLSRYQQLVALNAGYNLITKVDTALCQNLPVLKVLNLQHNELQQMSEKYYCHCASLIELSLASNRIEEIRGDPFLNLKNLTVLDISHNILKSVKLGSQPQLQSLQELLLADNKIIHLENVELYFLNKTSLEVLDLSSNPLKNFQTGCFRVIANLHALLLEKVPLGPELLEKLCSELSGTGIQTLLLRNIQLSSISNTTFSGLSMTNLTSLNLASNGLSIISNGAFASLPQLEHLNLENNHIFHLTALTFFGLSNLESLNLKKSLIGTNSSKFSIIDDLSFHWLGRLEHLIMEDNCFSEITPNTFTGLSSLRYLTLCNCSTDLKTVTNKTFSSLFNSSLISLNLTKCGIIRLQEGAFSSLRSLQVLDLGLNQIDQELRGYELKGLDSIEMIYLSFNKHLSLGKNSFSFVPSLRKLFMRRTALNIPDFAPSPFHSLQNLTVLDLSNNNLANFGEDILDGLHNLENLNLQHNNLARLWKRVNPGGPVLFLKHSVSLQILRLDSNGLDEIPVNAFRGLSKLKYLGLGLNNLNFFPWSVFDDQRSLDILNLHKNLITSVEKPVFESVFKSLKTLDMSANPFDCTCESISWFINWINVTNTSITDLSSEYICNTPPKYHGSFVTQFDNSACKDMAPFRVLFIINTTVILVFIFIVMLVRFQGWRIAFYWNVSVNRILGFKEIDKVGEQFEYDAYIIHAKKDENWVVKHLIPLEESSVRFCFEERDLEAGLPRLEGIIDSMKRSRKIIFVITQYFLKDPWCHRFKVHHAVQQAIEQSQDSIILIFLEDIPDYKLNQTCLRRGMVKSHCILSWPAQQERVTAFRQKLKVALGSSNKVN
ncbi:toll-like receptor 3 [Microcaecilia unicolor]|uniref:Toll-like receptor 3 n=1 Tax=Microcaecilia unicolor TaxID=1415580 RepID=A0A6P7X9T8_9AMPH|nr:toll-like receptor 3 [Microcaecilia unicolor]XP_030047344.1 toll-like receptor 3 [Microcaecilia unicolor]XP_030047345.1 toll-like receptor 3 [Microcaecilia unicolor]XP_030047346.1 toll-like receptor 3 [Microcaecilia unicolor]